MDNGSTTSVSKGCFVFKRQGKQSEEKLRFEGPHGKSRYEEYKKCLNKIEDIRKELERSVFSNVLENVACYVQRSTERNLAYSWGEVPAAALLTGVNMPDHVVVFNTLEELLYQHDINHVVRLTSKQCSNIKVMVQRAVQGLIGTDYEEECIQEQKCTLLALKEWYNKKENLYSPQKQPAHRANNTTKNVSPAKTTRFSLSPDKNTKKISSPTTKNTSVDVSSGRTGFKKLMVSLHRCTDFGNASVALSKREELVTCLTSPRKHISKNALLSPRSQNSSPKKALRKITDSSPPGATRKSPRKASNQDNRTVKTPTKYLKTSPDDKRKSPRKTSNEDNGPTKSPRTSPDDTRKSPRKLCNLNQYRSNESVKTLLKTSPEDKRKSPRKRINQTKDDKAITSPTKITKRSSEDKIELHRSSAKVTSPNKKQKASKFMDKQPLVVILEDTESFTPTVLQDFILICSEQVNSLPMVLVLGFALGISALRCLLSQRASSKLSLERFYSQPASSYLNVVIDKLMLDDCVPVRLGGKTLKILLDRFLYQDFAVSSFLDAYKLCVLEHYSTECFSFISGRYERFKELGKRDFISLRQISSFNAFLGTLPPKERQAYEDDEFLKDELESMLYDLTVHHRSLSCLVRFIFALLKNLPGDHIGCHVRELYHISLKQRLTESIEYEESMKFFKLLGREELTSRIDDSLETLAVLYKKYQIPQLGELGRELLDRNSEIKNLTKLTSPTKQQPTTLKLDKKMHSMDLQEKMLEAAKAKSRILNPYEALRDDLVKWLNEKLHDLLYPPTSLPFHELLYFENVSFLKNRVMPIPRTNIQRALVDPSAKLQCECCEIGSSSSIVASMPDLCIVYKLHLEYGRMINVYDWLQAFLAIITQDQKTSDTRKPKPQHQARFIQAVSELEFLGFIKQTKRKTDHVQRLTWESTKP